MVGVRLFVCAVVPPSAAGYRFRYPRGVVVLSILWDLANGAIKLRWDNVTTDSGAVQKGLAAELGLTGSTGDRRAYKAVLAKNGQSVDAYAHDLWQGAEWGQEVDDMALKDMILDVLQSTPNGSIALKELADMSGVQADLEAQISLGKGDIQRKLEEVDANLAKNAQQMADFRKRINDTVQKLESGKPLIIPIGEGEFGPIYDQFRGKPQEAVDFLLAEKNGEAIGALSHKDIGEIDLVWGKEGTGHSDGYGLSKLAKYHPEVLDKLQPILDDMEVVSRNANRVNLESPKYQAAVRLTWNNERKNWLLTAFEKRNSAIDNTTDTGETAISGKQNDTATLQSTASENKDTTSIPENQISEKEIFNTPTLPTNEDVPFMIERYDADGNRIGDGSVHSSYSIVDFSAYPQISHNVQKASGTESVYVTYTNNENGKSATMRFSGHESNAVRFGQQLRGHNYQEQELAQMSEAGKKMFIDKPINELMYRLGLVDKEIVTKYLPKIEKRNVSKNKVDNGEFEIADISLSELQKLPIGTDISKYKGKAIKDGNVYILVESDKVLGKPYSVEEYSAPENGMPSMIWNAQKLDNPIFKREVFDAFAGHLGETLGAESVVTDAAEIQRVFELHQAVGEGLRTAIVQNAEIAAERADIERVAKENGTWLKAPNGKDTNLTERQWVDVRTSRFKSWTGDWELAAKRVKIIDVKPRHNFNINQRVVLAKKEIIQWAKEHNIIRQLSNSNTGGKGTIGINPKSISKIVDDAYNIKDKSARQLYLNLLLYIEDIIRESALGESHLGYAKGADGARRPENGIDANVTIYRYYGAIKIGDKLQRVKTTVKKSNVIGSSNLYTYEIAKIELVDGKTVIDFSNNPSSNNSITFAKLLHNVENDKKNGEKLLDYTKIVDANGEPMVVYHGTVRSKDGKFNTFNAPNGLAWFSESKEHAMGFAGEKKLFKKRDLYSVYLNVRNPLNVGYLDIGGSFIAQDLAKTTGLPLNEIQSIVENLNPSWKWQVTNSEEFKRLAEKYGYDGFVAQEYNPSLKSYVKTYAVFNPNQIKSATENTGEYSPANDDIRYSLNLDDVTIATPEMEAEANLYTSSTSSPTPTLHPYPSIVGYRFRYLCLNSGILSHYLRRHPILLGIVFDT